MVDANNLFVSFDQIFSWVFFMFDPVSFPNWQTHCFSFRQNIFYVYSFKYEWNRIGLLSKWNDPSGTDLWNNENAFHVIHLFLFFGFFHVFEYLCSRFIHQMFMRCSVSYTNKLHRRKFELSIVSKHHKQVHNARFR